MLIERNSPVSSCRIKRVLRYHSHTCVTVITATTLKFLSFFSFFFLLFFSFVNVINAVYIDTLIVFNRYPFLYISRACVLMLSAVEKSLLIVNEIKFERSAPSSEFIWSNCFSHPFHFSLFAFFLYLQQIKRYTYVRGWWFRSRRPICDKRNHKNVQNH